MGRGKSPKAERARSRRSGRDLVRGYPFSVRAMSEADGSGYLVEFPDLPGCMADGESVEQALDEAHDAVESWIKTAELHGDTVPPPGSGASFSGRWVQRVPKSLHAELTQRAREEGVSLNQLVTSLLAKGVGRGS